MKNLFQPMQNMGFWAMASFSVFIYSSMAASSIGHVLLVLPGFYFTFLGWKKIDFPWSARFLSLFILIAIVSSFFAPGIENPFHSAGELRYFLAGLLSIPAFNAAMAMETSEKEVFDKRVRFFLYSSLIVAAVASINGIIGLYTGFNPLKFKAQQDPNRATGLYSMAITFGYGIQFMAIINAACLFFYRRISQYVNIWVVQACLVSTLAGLYYSGSRGALLGFLLGLPFLFARTQKEKFIKVMVAAGIMLVIALAIVFGGGSTTTRFLLPAKHDSNMIRISQYEAAYYAILERPILGHGYRHFGNESERIKKEHNIAFPDFISHAHNNYVELWADIGPFGMMAFILFLLFWMIESWKRADVIGDTTLAIVMAIAISGNFQCTLIDGENTFAIMFIYGLSMITKERMDAFLRLKKQLLSTS